MMMIAAIIIYWTFIIHHLLLYKLYAKWQFSQQHYEVVQCYLFIDE